MTYTQDQLNVIVRSYIEEIARLNEVKANKELVILSLRMANAELIKQNADLKPKVEDGTN